MRSRIVANNFRVTATSASWNVTYFECRVTFDPILTSFSPRVVNNHDLPWYSRKYRNKQPDHEGQRANVPKRFHCFLFLCCQAYLRFVSAIASGKMVSTRAVGKRGF